MSVLRRFDFSRAAFVQARHVFRSSVYIPFRVALLQDGGPCAYDPSTALRSRCGNVVAAWSKPVLLSLTLSFESGLHPGVPMTALHGAAANVRSEMMEGIGKMARTG